MFNLSLISLLPKSFGASKPSSEPTKIFIVEPTATMAANSGDRPIHRYTAFPNLCVDAPPAPNSGKPADNMTEFRVPCNLSAESVVTSWAQLLRGYVGMDGVVFRVDSETVGVNFLDGSVEYLPEGSVQIPEDEGAGQRCSGVYFQTVRSFLSE